jgi:hypothetical protein
VTSLLFSSFLGVLALEYLGRTSIASRVSAALVVIKNALRIAASTRISDQRKEILLRRYARRIAAHTGMLALTLSGCALILVLSALVLDWAFAPNPSTVDALSSVRGVLAITFVAVIYVSLKKYLASRRLQPRR